MIKDSNRTASKGTSGRTQFSGKASLDGWRPLLAGSSQLRPDLGRSIQHRQISGSEIYTTGSPSLQVRDAPPRIARARRNPVSLAIAAWDGDLSRTAMTSFSDGIHDMPDYTARRPSTAASTRTSTPPASRIAAAGSCSPARQRATASRLASPSTMNSTSRVRLKRAALSDTRCGGGFGAWNTTSASGALAATPQSRPGNRLAVWPSSPRPSSTRSKSPTPRSVCA